LDSGRGANRTDKNNGGTKGGTFATSWGLVRGRKKTVRERSVFDTRTKTVWNDVENIQEMGSGKGGKMRGGINVRRGERLRFTRVRYRP